MADEEAFFVVVRVDEPAGDAVGVAAFDLAGLRFEDIDSVAQCPERSEMPQQRSLCSI